MKGYSVEVAGMPNPDEPVIRKWVSKLQSILPKPKRETYFIGHSVGCQAILRYLELLPENSKVGKVILVAPWTRLKPVINEEEGAEQIAKPWIQTPIAGASPTLFLTLSYLIFRDPVTKQQKIGIGVTLVGILLLSFF